MIYDFFELYLIKNCFITHSKIDDYYSYFLKQVSDLKKFNLDEESTFMEFEYKLLNG